MRTEPGTAARREVTFAEGERTSIELTAAGAMVGALAGGAVAILAIIGLMRTGSVPTYLMEVGAIVLGAGLLIQGVAGATRFASSTDAPQGRFEKLRFGSGVTAAAVAGVAGIGLGIAAIVGVAPLVLTSIAVIVFGAASLLSVGAMTEIHDSVLARFASAMAPETRHTIFLASALELLVGVAAVVLGIIALFNLVPITLNLVGLLCLGVSALLSGLATGGALGRLLGMRTFVH
jgi:hypothetical protein